MRLILLSALFMSAGLLAQESPPKGQSGPKKAAYAARQFTEFPVAEATPQDLGLTSKAAMAALLGLPEGDGGDQWPYEGVYREDGGQLPVGYRVGGTAIVCMGLAAAPGYRDDTARQQALQKGLGFVLKELDADRMSLDFLGTYDVRGWGHIYALQMLLQLQDHRLVPKDLAEEVAKKTKWLVEALVSSAIPTSGGWNYARGKGYLSPSNKASTFMTPAALQALFHAKARGHEVPDNVVTEALDALERARAKPGGYGYGAAAESQSGLEEEQLSMMDKTPSSAARATICETTLMLAGRGDPARLERAVELFFAHWDDLAVRKSRTGTHIKPYGIAPYYFLFGHVYAAQAIEHIADTEKRDAFRNKMRVVLLRSQEEDGSWNDRQFGRSAGYGTAMALLTMHMPTLRPALPWRAGAVK